MYGLTQIGVVHTAISLIAVFAALYAFVRDKGIDAGNGTGKLYIVTTILTCLSGFFIFQHGGFGKAHALGIITLVVLALAGVARNSGVFGRASRSVETVCYSATFLFHMIPAITESATRLPPGAPLLDSAEAPELKAATGVLVVLFLIGATLQLRRLRAGKQGSARSVPVAT